jgi:hypothetical protein
LLLDFGLLTNFSIWTRGPYEHGLLDAGIVP